MQFKKEYISVILLILGILILSNFLINKPISYAGTDLYKYISMAANPFGAMQLNHEAPFAYRIGFTYLVYGLNILLHNLIKSL